MDNTFEGCKIPNIKDYSKTELKRYYEEQNDQKSKIRDYYNKVNFLSQDPS